MHNVHCTHILILFLTFKYLFIFVFHTISIFVIINYPILNVIIFRDCRKLSSQSSIKIFNIYMLKNFLKCLNQCLFFFFRKYENDPELREKYENSLYILGTLQYPTFKDLSIFSNYNPVINVPTDSIKHLMLKVT